MIVVRPFKAGEPDLLPGNQAQPLRFVTLGGDRELARVPAPAGGWTHAALEACTCPADAWDAFLGVQWIGSSEV